MWLYNLGVTLYAWAIRLAALRHSKARLWVEGRKDLFRRMAEAIDPSARIIWIHVASLGEFEQELGVLEEGYIMGDVYLREQTTLYTVIGNLFAYICLGMSVVALGTSFFIYIKDSY